MPDFFNSRSKGAPDGWSKAFAALPMETPPMHGWARITRALDGPVSRRGAMQRERRMSWMIGLASAAVLAVAAWSPFSHWLQDGTGHTAPTVVATEAPGLRGPAAPLRNEGMSIEPAIQPAVDEVHGADSSASVAVSKTIHRMPSRSARPMARHSRGESTSAGTSPPSTPVRTGIAPVTAAVAAGVELDPLQKLKTQSAQLETHVALGRDEHVANASSELLSSGLDSGIAAVDAALSQSDLADTRKQELWQQRVDLLQQLAGVEATSRWLAAQGMSNETALVSVY